MNNSIKLQFLNDDADENEGLGDAGIETYKDAIYASIARETGQNSADAWTSHPIKMSFDIITISRVELPDLQKFEATIDICLRQAVKEKDEKAIDFFQRAKNVVQADKIVILKIADYNTKGLTGPSERGTPFHSLVKGSGISVKESQTSGGSFGIGKNAAFAVSELQTVFYSSQYLSNNNKLEFIAQGKSVLVSHIDKTGIPKKGKGYWGYPNYKAISNIDDIPSWLYRKEQGTSIFSVGFRLLFNWQYKMAASLLSNFFCAIHWGKMEFTINDGEIKVNKSTLPDLFSKSEILKGAEENNSLDNFEFARSLFTCITSPFVKERILNHDILGVVSVKILVQEGMPKKVALIRNGMLITDSLEYFGDKFSRFPMSKEFIAVVEAKDDVGNALIKRLENPRHDGLSAERLHDPQKAREANSAIKSLIRLIREAIKEETITVPENEVTVDELTEFFADDNIKRRSDNHENEDDIETFVYRATDKTTRHDSLSLDQNNGLNNTRGVGISLQGTGIGNNKRVNRDNHDKSRNEIQDFPGNRERAYELHLNDVRNILVKTEVISLRRIFFTATSTCHARVSIWATGINDNEQLGLVSAEGATIDQNELILDFITGQRVCVNVQIADNYEGPIEIFAHTTDLSNEN